MRLLIASAFLLITAFSARSATPPQKTIDQICAERACRPGGYEAVIRIDNEHYKTIPVTRSPYVTEDGEILIFPGETLAVRFSVKDGKLTSPAFYKAFSARLPQAVANGDTVAANPRDNELARIEGELSAQVTASLPADTLLVSYGQIDDASGMVMILDHSAAVTVKVDATMFIIQAGNYKSQYTSTCPIEPGLTSYESWPHEIGPMLISNVRFLAEDDTTACK